MDPAILKIYAGAALVLVILRNFMNGRNVAMPMTLERVLHGLEVRQCILSCSIPFFCVYVVAESVGMRLGYRWIIAYNLFLLLGALAMVAGARSISNTKRPS